MLLTEDVVEEREEDVILELVILELEMLELLVLLIVDDVILVEDCVEEGILLDELV